MKDRAEADGDVFLPNPEPLGPAEYVFVCMEPSLGRRSPEEATARVEAGARNFVSSVEDFILHFCIRQYLCEPTERYHITDLSKGAMLVKRASIDRSARYDSWYGLLLEELDLVAKPGAGIFAVGNAVAQYLTRREFPWPFTRVIHYSGQAGRARAAASVGHKDDFEKFRNSVSRELLLATAKDVLKTSLYRRICETRRSRDWRGASCPSPANSSSLPTSSLSRATGKIAARLRCEMYSQRVRMFGSPYLTGVPSIRPLRAVRLEPACRPLRRPGRHPAPGHLP